MSFEDDKVRWQNAAQRMLNLQQLGGGTLVTNLNVILDELNSLDHATNVVEKKEDALPVLSKCCCLVISCGDDDFLVTKFCQLIVNLLSKQKVLLDQETLNVLVPFLVNSINTSKKWTLVNLVRALASTLYENGAFCNEFAESLLGQDGVLVKLCGSEPQDIDLLCSAVQCVANICMSPTAAPDALTMEDEFLTNAFNLLLDLMKGSTPKMHGSVLEHFRLINAVLRAFPHVLVLGCSGQKENLGPLLSALKNYMFCGLPGYKPQYTERSSLRTQESSDIEPDDLSTVHLSTIPQKDRTYSALSKKKKRHPNKKKTKHGTAPPTPKQITTSSSSMDALTPQFATHGSSVDALTPKFAAHSSSVDALTPKFATQSCLTDAPTPDLTAHSPSTGSLTPKRATHISSMDALTPKFAAHSSSVDALTPKFSGCSLNRSPKEPVLRDDQSGLSHRLKNQPRHAVHYTNRNVTQNNSHEAGTESSGYHSTSSISSSDSEYSDSEAGQTARLRSIMSKVRLNVLLCLQGVIKSTDKKVLFGYWSSFVPDNTVSSPWSLFTTILKDPTPKGRAGGVAVLMDLLDGSRQFLVAAEDREQHSSSPSARPFTSFSVKLSGIVHELHRCLLQALIAETFATTKAQILKCLSILVLNSPYNRLKEGLLSKVVRQLRPLLAVKDPNLQTAVLSCLRMVVCVHTPLPEVVELMRPTSAEVSIGNKGVSQTSTNSTPERQSDSADVKAPDLQVPPDAPWLINWCAHAANKRDTSLVLRLEALQFLGSFVKSYVFLASSSVECLRNLACSCLKDSDVSFSLSALKLLEELARALNSEISSSQSGRNVISKEQVLLFWQQLLGGPLTSILQDDASLPAARCAAVDCLSNVGAVILNKLPVNVRILCITLLLGLSNDEDKNLKASSVRALGVFVLYPCLRDDVLFVADTANKVLEAMTDPRLVVRMRAAWSLANISDSLVNNMSSDDKGFMEDFSDMLLLKLLNTSITAADDNEKVKSNAVRALGNFLRYIRTSTLEKAGFMEAVEKAIHALIRNVGSGLMKVRWNACYAFGNVFRNPCLPIGTAPWTSEVYSALENVICDCKNFKVRINAVLALSVPPERRYYGDTALYCHVYATLIDTLKGTENVTEFSEFKYRDTLRQQLCNSLCHMTTLMTTEDSVSLTPVLEGNHDTYKGYIRDYIRQLHSQESPAEDQTSEKTAAEKLSTVQEARRRVHEELHPCNTTVKILQDVFDELCKGVE